MSWTSTRRQGLVVLLLLACGAVEGAAQGAREGGLRVMAAASEPAFGGAGFAVAWRDPRRTRLGAAVALGTVEGGAAAARLDVAWHFLLDPRKRSGTAVYGGGGLSVAARQGEVEPFLLLVLGVENAPGGRRGSYIEVGVGGGVRVEVGMRWRKRNAPDR